jgi:hypothetical protein
LRYVRRRQISRPSLLPFDARFAFSLVKSELVSQRTKKTTDV